MEDQDWREFVGLVTPAVDRVIALEEVPDAIRDLIAGRARGKIVIAT
jgi:NADPH:quinone reductase-like Zn-dependent oxidoreductase